MKLSEFKKKLNELEVKLLLEYKLTDEEIDVALPDDYQKLETWDTYILRSSVFSINIEDNVKDQKYICIT